MAKKSLPPFMAAGKGKSNFKDNPALEKKEEKDGKDLDNDGEKGEPPKHRAKVLGNKGAAMPVKGAKMAAKGVKKCPTCGQPMPCGGKHSKKK
ncbi:MAG: hypothetical protein ACJ788_00065 [Ktedonobacteraceae bacterium]